jgi:hypothetical protein
MLSTEVATAAPVDEAPLPVAPSEAWAAVRTALLAAEDVAEELEAADDGALAPSTVTLRLVTVGLAAMMVGFVVGRLCALPAEATVEDSGWGAGGVMAAGPVLAVGAVTEPDASWVVAEPLG